MSLITDPAWIIHHLRSQYLTSTEDTSGYGHRIISFKQVDDDEERDDATSYIFEELPENAVCYSPNIPHVSSELSRQPLSKRTTSILDPNSGKVDSGKGHLETKLDMLLTEIDNDNKTSDISKVEPIVPTDLWRNGSALADLIKAGSISNNPFASGYSYISGQGESNPIELRIYYPYSLNPKVPLVIVVKRDATVDEIIGYSLYSYIENSVKPDIRQDKTFCQCSSWDLRIVEDDGSIDEDFPALERKRKISKFSFDQFAVCINAPFKKNDMGSGSTSAGSANIFVKVHLYSTLEVKQTTTISLPRDMLLSHVLIVCCKKRKIDPNDYTLKMPDTKTDVPLDRTLEKLGITELCLLKKDRGASAGDIFLRPPEEDVDQDVDFEVPAHISDEYNSVYKKYTVNRRLPMIMGKQERVFAIDGDYVYVLPPENKNFFDSVKTVSFHGSTINSCKPLKKNSNVFKLTCNIKGDLKSFEFEAATPQEACIF